jgi:hypothetical protein
MENNRLNIFILDCPGGIGSSAAIVDLISTKEPNWIIVDDLYRDLPKLIDLIELKPPHAFNLGINETNFTPCREYGWYRKFQKVAKNRNLKKVK